MRKSITLCLMAMALTVQAQQGGITPDVLKEIKSSYKPTASDKAIYNAMAGTSIAVLAKNHERLANFDTHLLAVYGIECAPCADDGKIWVG